MNEPPLMEFDHSKAIDQWYITSELQSMFMATKGKKGVV
jgi:hypothetical protein